MEWESSIPIGKRRGDSKVGNLHGEGPLRNGKWVLMLKKWGDSVSAKRDRKPWATWA
jgi:hypothetical protein